MKDKFRAIRVNQVEGRTHAALATLSVEDIDQGNVLVNVQYSSMNYKDALLLTGKGKIARKFPIIVGIDLAGVVVETMDTRLKVGDRVVCTGFGLSETRDGGYSEYISIPGDFLLKLPESLTPFEAMAMGTAGLTAALSIHRLEQNGIKPDQGPVLVTGATGGVGSLAIDMLAGLGYQVSALTGKEREQEYLKGLGASETILRQTIQTSERPLEKGLWAAALDGLGGDILAWLCRTVKPCGAIASYGLAASTELKTTVLPFIVRGISLLGIDSVNCPMPLRMELWKRLGSDLRPRHLQASVNTLTLDEVVANADKFIDGSVRGRYVVSVADQS